MRCETIETVTVVIKRRKDKAIGSDTRERRKVKIIQFYT